MFGVWRTLGPPSLCAALKTAALMVSSGLFIPHSQRWGGTKLTYIKYARYLTSLFFCREARVAECQLIFAALFTDILVAGCSDCIKAFQEACSEESCYCFQMARLQLRQSLACNHNARLNLC